MLITCSCGHKIEVAENFEGISNFKVVSRKCPKCGDVNFVTLKKKNGNVEVMQ
jgi:phage FluMu protein Com